MLIIVELHLEYQFNILILSISSQIALWTPLIAKVINKTQILSSSFNMS